jgi:hypothetical protein
VPGASAGRHPTASSMTRTGDRIPIFRMVDLPGAEGPC